MTALQELSMDDLSHLFGAYFYEDWDEYEYESWQQAVDDFARRSPGRVTGAAANLQQLLSERLTEEELDERLALSGCSYVAPEGNRAWLELLLARLRSIEAGGHSLSRAN